MSGSRSKLPIAALAALLLATAGFLHTFLREAAAKRRRRTRYRLLFLRNSRQR